MNIVALFNALPGGCAQGLIWGIMAIGVFITYKILDLADLTVDGTMCTGGAVCVVMMMNGHSVGFSLFCAFIAGMLAGLVTGIFHTTMGIPAILAGILTQLGLYSINLRIMGNKANVALVTDKYDVLVSMRYLKNVVFYKNTLFVVAVIIAVLIVILYWFFGTELGCSIRSTGSNENMSRAQGINTDLTKIIGLMLSNGIVALSSGLLAQYQGFADINTGVGIVVVGLASVIIGEVLLGRRSLSWGLFSAIIGAVVYRFIIAIVLKIGAFPAFALKLVSAVVVALALSVPTIRASLALHRRKKAAKKQANAETEAPKC